jgi:hypothetical protein
MRGILIFNGVYMLDTKQVLVLPKSFKVSMVSLKKKLNRYEEKYKTQPLSIIGSVKQILAYEALFGRTNILSKNAN